MAARAAARLLTTLVQVLALCAISEATKNYYIHWNTSNPIFQISNTDHIIDVNKGNNLFEYDQVTIICPEYTDRTREEDTEKYIIYNVSKEEYDTCRITNPNPRIIAVCDKPYKLMFFTITFRSFTPQPGGLEFRPGQDYYFISTSARGDMLRRIGGRCSTHNMKVVFKVCCNDTERNHIVDHGPVLQLPGPQTDQATTTTGSSAWSPARTTAATTRRPTSRHPYKGVHDLYNLQVPSINVKATTKKSEEYDKNKFPNDIATNATNEGLKSAARSTVLAGWCTSLVVSIGCLLMLRLRPG